MKSSLVYPLSLPNPALSRLQELRFRPAVTISDARCFSHIRFLFAATNLKLAPRRKANCSPSAGVGVVDEDDEVCPVDCVREFKTDEEFYGILEKAKETGALVVIDFFRTSCGSCKYIEQGFSKLCRGAGKEDAPVMFFKHNVIDEYDEQSEVADRLRIKAVPLFHFYKDGVLLEAFPTRDKERIIAAINKHTSPA